MNWLGTSWGYVKTTSVWRIKCAYEEEKAQKSLLAGCNSCRGAGRSVKSSTEICFRLIGKVASLNVALPYFLVTLSLVFITEQGLYMHDDVIKKKKH